MVGWLTEIMRASGLWGGPVGQAVPFTVDDGPVIRPAIRAVSVPPRSKHTVAQDRRRAAKARARRRAKKLGQAK